MNSIRFIPIVLCALTLMLTVTTCHDLSSGPEAQESSVLRELRGTWLHPFDMPDSARISFDTDSMKFIDQSCYQFGICREFLGTFSITSSNIELNYDFGSTTKLQYQLLNGELILRTSPDGGRFVRLGTLPSHHGWSRKCSVLSERSLGPLSAYIFSIGNSDSGMVALAEFYGYPGWTFLKVSLSATVIATPAAGINAIDGRGPYLWVATDSTVVKRTLYDPRPISSFTFRNAVSSEFVVTGLAIDSLNCYLIAINGPKNEAWLVKFNLNGILLTKTKTSVVFKDLALVGGRLFALTGDETFCELDPNSGYVKNNYNVTGRSFGNNIDGIALVGFSLQLMSFDSNHKLRLSTLSGP